MNRISVKVKADSWLTTAAKEIRRIQTRWGIPSQRKFAVLLGVNGRTLAKLYADPPDESLTYGSVQQMFSNLMISVWTEFKYDRRCKSRAQIAESGSGQCNESCIPTPQRTRKKGSSRDGASTGKRFANQVICHKMLYVS